MSILWKHNGHRSVGRGLIGWMLAGLALMALPAMVAAQEAVSEQEASYATIDVDTLMLLLSEEVMPTQPVEDGIWKISPGSGRRIIQLPLMIEAGKQDTDFDASTVRLRASRLIAWRTVDPESLKAPENSDAARELEAGLEDLPTFTRAFTLTPKGRLLWKMDRIIPGGELKVLNYAAGTPERLYVYRISPQILAEAMPKMERLTRNQGESAMDFNARNMVANSEFRIARENYMQLRKQVTDLPDSFDIDAPRRVWGVFDVLLHERTLEITGTSQNTWRVNLDMLERLREISKSTMQAEGKVDSSHLAALVTLGQDPHPYSQRLVAYALSRSGAVKTARLNDQLYQMLTQMLQGSDLTAKRVVIKEIASVLPPTQASLALLKNVAKSDLDPRSRIETIKGMLSADFTQPGAQSQDAIGNIQDALADPDGPAPAEVFEEVFKLTRENPDLATSLATGLRFSNLPEDRLKLTAAAIASYASSQPLAALWLDQQLLGSMDANVVGATLEVIAGGVSKPGSGGNGPQATIRRGIAKLFGSDEPTANQPDASQEAQADLRIPVYTANHGLFRALRSPDAKVRQLAWQALPHFVLADQRQQDPYAMGLPQDGNNQPQPQGAGRYEALVDAALQQNPTPAAAANFLVNQPDKDRAAAAMVLLVLRGSSEAAGAACRNLLAMKASIEPSLSAMPFGERAGFATRFYENTTGKSLLAVNLLRQRTPVNPMVTWFAQQIALGQLPDEAGWAASPPNEGELVDLITSSDPDVGLAAIAVLVYRVSGTDADVPALGRMMRSLADQSRENLISEWHKARRKLLMAQFEDVIGPYQLVLALDGKEYPLGVVQFQSDGQSIRFGNQDINLTVPEDRLAIRIEKPGQLRSFSQQPELVSLSMDDIPPIELLPQAEGVWAGEVSVSYVQAKPMLKMKPLF